MIMKHIITVAPTACNGKHADRETTMSHNLVAKAYYPKGTFDVMRLSIFTKYLNTYSS